MGKTEVRGKGVWGTLAHIDCKSLDLVSVSNAQPSRSVNYQIDHRQFEDFLSLVSVDKTEVTGKIFLVPRYILEIKECHVISF